MVLRDDGGTTTRTRLEGRNSWERQEEEERRSKDMTSKRWT